MRLQNLFYNDNFKPSEFTIITHHAERGVGTLGSNGEFTVDQKFKITS